MSEDGSTQAQPVRKVPKLTQQVESGEVSVVLYHHVTPTTAVYWPVKTKGHPPSS